MYDQNPMLHKLNIDDLARDYQAQRGAHATSSGKSGLIAFAITLTVVMAAVFLNAANVV